MRIRLHVVSNGTPIVEGRESHPLNNYSYQSGEVIEITSFPCSMGRGRNNHLKILSEDVSRLHGEIHSGEEGSFVYKDSSMNGTYINGTQFNKTSVILKNDDKIQITFLVLRVEITDGTEENQTVESKWGNTQV